MQQLMELISHTRRSCCILLFRPTALLASGAHSGRAVGLQRRTAAPIGCPFGGDPRFAWRRWHPSDDGTASCPGRRTARRYARLCRRWFAPVTTPPCYASPCCPSNSAQLRVATASALATATKCIAENCMPSENMRELATPVIVVDCQTLVLDPSTSSIGR